MQQSPTSPIASAREFHGTLISFVDSLEHAVFSSHDRSEDDAHLHCLGVRSMQLEGLSLSVAREIRGDGTIELVSADDATRVSCSFAATRSARLHPVHRLDDPTTLAPATLLRALAGTCSILSFYAASDDPLLILRACSIERDVFAWFRGVSSLAFSSSGLAVQTASLTEASAANRLRLAGGDERIELAFSACGVAQSLAALDAEGREVMRLRTAESP
jgi:hypothetical protein